MIEVDMIVWAYVCIVGLFSFGSCCAMAGLLWYTLRGVTESKEMLGEKVSEFNDIMMLASKANTSQAEKIVELTTRLENLEGWRSMIGITDTKKKWTH